MFFILGLNFVLLGFKLEVSSYHKLFYSNGKAFGLLADIVLTLFLMGSFVIMLSGSKEILSELLSLNKNIALLLTMLIIFIINYYGLEIILTVNSILIPLLIIVVFLVGFILINFDLFLQADQFNSDLTSFMSALRYSGYNLILALVILLPVTENNNKSDVILGLFFGSCLLIIIAGVITLLLLQNYVLILSSEVPMLKLLQYYSKELYLLYGFILWIAILTTAICNLYGITLRCNTLLELNKKKTLLLILIFGIISMNFSFSDWIEIIYQELGRLSLVLIAIIVIKNIKYSVFGGYYKK